MGGRARCGIAGGKRRENGPTCAAIEAMQEGQTQTRGEAHVRETCSQSTSTGLTSSPVQAP